MVCGCQNGDDAGRFGKAIDLEKPRMLEHPERLPEKFERYRGRPVKNLPQRREIDFLDVALSEHRQQHRRDEKRDRSPMTLYRFERLRWNELAKHDRLEARHQPEDTGTNPRYVKQRHCKQHDVVGRPRLPVVTRLRGKICVRKLNALWLTVRAAGE